MAWHLHPVPCRGLIPGLPPSRRGATMHAGRGHWSPGMPALGLIWPGRLDSMSLMFFLFSVGNKLSGRYRLMEFYLLFLSWLAQQTLFGTVWRTFCLRAVGFILPDLSHTPCSLSRTFIHLCALPQDMPSPKGQTTWTTRVLYWNRTNRIMIYHCMTLIALF